MKEYKTNLPILKFKYVQGTYNKRKISNSSELSALFLEHFDKDTIGYQEQIIIMYLLNGKTLGVNYHSFGATNASLVDIKQVIAGALISGSDQIAIAHNHPSGETTPSREDINITLKLKDACYIMGLKLLDHIIVTPDNNYYSFIDNDKL